MVSIVLRTCNRAKSLQRALTCLEHQTYRPMEIIVIDHDSTDNTRQVIRSFGESVRYHRHTGSFHDTFNVWRDLVRGEFVSVLDDDDYLTPQCIDTLAKFLHRHHEVDIVYSRHQYVTCEQDHCKLLKQSPFIPAGKIKKKLLTSNVVPWNSVLFRRECLHAIPKIEGSMRGAYDWFFWVHAALSGCRFHQIDCILGYIQKSPDSVQFEIERMSTGALKCIEYYGKHLNLKDRLLYGYPHVYGFRLIRHGIICLENNRIRTGRLLFCRGLFFFLFSFRDRKSFAVAILIWLTARLSDPRTARLRIEKLFDRYLFRNQYEIVRFEQAR